MNGKAILLTLPYVLKKQSNDEIYKYYITSAIGGIAGMPKTYSELISDIDYRADDRSADEVVMDIIEGAGIEVRFD